MKLLLTALLLLCIAAATVEAGADQSSENPTNRTIKAMTKTLENTLWCGVRRESSGDDMLVAYEFLPAGKAFMIWVWLPRSDAKEPNGAIMLGSYAVDVKYEPSSLGMTIIKHDGKLVFHYRGGLLVNEDGGRDSFTMSRIGILRSSEQRDRSSSGKHLPSIMQHLIRPTANKEKHGRSGVTH